MFEITEILIVCLLLPCGQFNDAVNSVAYTASNGTMITAQHIGIDAEERGRSLIFWVYAGNCLGELRKITKHMIQDSRSFSHN